MTLVPDIATTDSAVTADSTFRTLLRFLGTMRRVMDPFFAQHGISGAQYGILSALAAMEKQGQACPKLGDLSEKMLIRPPSITNAIDRLIRAGLIEKACCTDDHRVKRVKLSEAGRKLVKQVADGHSAKMAAIFSVLSVDQQQQFRQMLGGLVTHLETLEKIPAVASPAVADAELADDETEESL